MINSIPINHSQSHHIPSQSLGGSCPTGCKLEEMMEVGPSTGDTQHSRTVQALRKYLQRKLSSEDSSSERESQSPQETDISIRSFETTEESKSTLTCSIVCVNPTSGRNNFPLQKQRSLDEYYSYSVPHSSAPHPIIPDHRYLRTDLCVPILLSRCTFCDQSFELDDQLRAHMRDKHWNYFFDNPPTHPFSQVKLQEGLAGEALDLSMRKSSEVTGSLPNLCTMQSFSSSGSLFGDTVGRGCKKGVVKCATCGKGFSTKWNWKQHQKIHLRESLQASMKL